ncbi:hypothetical protein [Streptomyces sp. CC208A]|uniref:hypothetical protein n=1 Tax=Streptomyces sp. CC208A TaxID=3044573 RepID=UPI0024A875D7|nr:hypothetical protein [Streptomyces sp. CC208A]
MIELDHRVNGIRDGVDSPELRRRLAVADLYELTCEMFWGDLTFRAEGADFSGPGPVFDAAYCLYRIGEDLKAQPKRTYSAAGGAGEYFFTRKGESVRIREEHGPSGSVSYEEFRTATKAFLRSVIADLCACYPELGKNQEILSLKSRLKTA